MPRAFPASAVSGLCCFLALLLPPTAAGSCSYALVLLLFGGRVRLRLFALLREKCLRGLVGDVGDRVPLFLSIVIGVVLLPEPKYVAGCARAISSNFSRKSFCFFCSSALFALLRSWSLSVSPTVTPPAGPPPWVLACEPHHRECVIQIHEQCAHCPKASRI